jgi:hypothetical protein
MKEYKVWKTITIGKKPDTTGINISNYAQSILDIVKWGKNETIDLVRVKASDLGFTEKVLTTQLFAKAKKEGLELCPPQVGLQLRVDYTDQPLNEWLSIAMEPITASGGRPSVFRLEHSGGGLWLSDAWAKPGNAWGPGDEFVFSLRKSKTLKLKPLASDTLTLRHFEFPQTDWEYLETYLSQTKIGKLFLRKLGG